MSALGLRLAVPDVADPCRSRIAANGRKNSTALRTPICPQAVDPRTGAGSTVLRAAWDGIRDASRTDAFRQIQELKRLPTLPSKNVSPDAALLEDLLLPGESYEAAFDRFEDLCALRHADQADGAWGHSGRFADTPTRPRGTIECDPFSGLVKEARDAGDRRKPLREGLVGDRVRDLRRRNDRAPGCPISSIGGDTVTGSLTDLLADARHWCDRHGESFADLDRAAHRIYLAEVEDAGRVP